jgi:hypothetical protein
MKSIQRFEDEVLEKLISSLIKNMKIMLNKKDEEKVSFKN